MAKGGGLDPARELFPVSPPLPGSFPVGRGRGWGQSGWEPKIPGSRNTRTGAHGLLQFPLPHISGLSPPFSSSPLRTPD